MIPSLVVNELRSALVEYLASTFALADDDVRKKLSEFLEDSGEGIFRGPYLRVRTPFRSVDDDWQWPLQWMHEGFVPHAHQGRAFDRLSTLDGREPSPTIVTTGTGSGKTECFLYPILDHCARMRAEGQDGIKALILYPMNALASDQAGRLAELISSQEELAGVTAGLYVGQEGRHGSMGADHLIDQREALRNAPPDILLTNYKMLDFLLLRREDRDLWAVNEPDTLRYVVLDEFHTYDGAQGTDVAMLLRRLGRTLKMADESGPIGSATPVATSATLGSGTSAVESLCGFATKVFGTPFDADAVIGETRQTVEETCGDVNYLLPIPDVSELDEVGDDLDAIAEGFCRAIDGEDRDADLGDVFQLGSLLLKHPLTRAVLGAVADRPRTWRTAVEEIIARAPSWGAAAMRDPASVERALAKFLWLLSVARREQGGKARPLLSVDVQLWIREVSRLLRAVDTEPAFRWQDSAAPETGEPLAIEMPAVYCRRCGMSGWMALQPENSNRLKINSRSVYTAALDRSGQVRTLLRASADDPDAKHFDSVTRLLASEPGDDTVPVFVTPDEEAAKQDRCPACDERNAIRFLGLRTASLASVSINTLFASPNVVPEQRKLLAFTDSVQDASHRASFFAGRTHRINLRSLMASALRESSSLSLADLGDVLIADADSERDRFALVPPDLLRHPKVRTVWTDEPDPEGVAVLTRRVAFEADLEFGLRSRVGRTLELSRVAAATVEIPNLDDVIDLVREDLLHQHELDLEPGRLTTYVRGLLERLRTKGGISNPLLDPYVADNGRQWHIWGGRPDGLPPFTPDQGRPTFFTTAKRGDFDSLTATGFTPSWLVDWATKCLDVEPVIGADINMRVMALLAHETEAVIEVGGANRIFALDRRYVTAYDIVDDDPTDPTPGGVRCSLCGYRHPTPTHLVAMWEDAPCLRYRCHGRLTVEAPTAQNYYRQLYREHSEVRRVVTAEHTGLLSRRAREDLEKAFKSGTAADAPNVVAATPTLEMGIDIGDLSAVMLTSVPRNPASYVQRIGRAGRASGNALITTFVGTDTHGLYYLSEPEAMIDGEVRPPDCYLDAFDTLCRQYVAYLIDRIADLTIDGPPVDTRMGTVMKKPFDDGGLFRRLVEASTLDSSHITSFLGLFGSQLDDATGDRLEEFAAGGIEPMLKNAAEVFSDQVSDLERRRTRMRKSADKIAKQKHRSEDDEADLRSVQGQIRGIGNQLRDLREDYALSGLERFGVLPNFTLVDDAVTLEATTWWQDEEGYQSETVEYARNANLAVRELAPGNSFYVAGHRHQVDALHIGAESEPHYEPWKLCPECGFGAVETEGSDPITACPRCGLTGIGDTGAAHTMLRLRRVMSTSSEEAARVFDEDDDRRREAYDVITTVDAEPEHISNAWRITGRTFGAEQTARTHIRTINLGFAQRQGEQVPIAGHPRHVSRFNVCRSCGAVFDVRDDRDGARPERLHQGWCKAKAKGAEAKSDKVVLFHELTTEAIRLLLPVSLFEIDERLVSFTGALLLGLREDFGGELDHLSVMRSEAPNTGGQGRRNFLVLFDAVPGGTGYLGRLGDPERMRKILSAARDVILNCPCQGEGRPACHRCLLGVIDRREYELASTKLALELLDDLLENWETEFVGTIAGLDMGKVEESELERRFKVALHDWVDKLAREAKAEGKSEPVSIKSVPGHGGREAFEIRFDTDDGVVRYRIDEQEGLSTTPSTTPDFVIARQDGPGRKIAVYLDGFQFHASPDHNSIAGDAQKRRGIRTADHLVWSLTWDDVEHFHKAALSESAAGPQQRPMLTGQGRQVALALHHQKDGDTDFKILDRNPMQLLLDYLQRPSDGQWKRLALSAAGGAFASAEQQIGLSKDDVRPAVEALLGGNPADVASSDDPRVMLGVHTTVHGLDIGCLLDSPFDHERWTVIAALADDDGAIVEPTHRKRWHDWLQWSNILQFIDGIGRQALLGAASIADEMLEDVWLLDVLGGGTDPDDDAHDQDGDPVALSEDDEDELLLIEEPAVAELVKAVLRRGAPSFVAGYELDDGRLLEAAWHEACVGIAAEGDDEELAGWDVRTADKWTIDSLLSAIANG